MSSVQSVHGLVVAAIGYAQMSRMLLLLVIMMQMLTLLMMAHQSTRLVTTLAQAVVARIDTGGCRAE